MKFDTFFHGLLTKEAKKSKDEKKKDVVVNKEML
jgi:hypothetical protein